MSSFLKWHDDCPYDVRFPTGITCAFQIGRHSADGLRASDVNCPPLLQLHFNGAKGGHDVVRVESIVISGRGHDLCPCRYLDRKFFGDVPEVSKNSRGFKGERTRQGGSFGHRDTATSGHLQGESKRRLDSLFHCTLTEQNLRERNGLKLR